MCKSPIIIHERIPVVQVSRLLSLIFLFSVMLSLFVGSFKALSGVPVQASTLSAEAVTLFVATEGSDENNDCSAKAAPCATIQHAIAVALEGDEIHVAAGKYGGLSSESIPDVGIVNATLIITKNIAALLGGYSSDFTSRQPAQQISTIDGSTSGTEWVIFVGAVTTRIDGFTLTGIDNGAASQGGAIQVNAGTPSLSNNRIIENRSPAKGGAIYVSGGNPTIASNQIYSNSAPSGGGIYVLTGTVLITDNVIFGNIAQKGHGGGIYVANGDVLIANNTIARNQAISGTVGRGGGLFVENGNLLGIRGNLIYENQSSDGGSGIETNVGTEVYGNILHHNQVLFAGSALLMERTQEPITLVNNLVYKNQGSGITLRDFSTALIVNNTSHQNFYVSFGGPGNGIDVNASVTPTVAFTATILNNLFTNNAQCGIEAYNGVTIVNDYNDLFNNKEDSCNIALQSSGTHNLNLDPQYTGPAIDNYRPLPGTAVVDQGTTANAPSIDIFGDPRPYANGIDMGAIEAGPALVYLPLINR